MSKVHMFEYGADHRSIGQTEFEFTHTTKCGYVRDEVTRRDTEVTCKICLNLINNRRVLDGKPKINK